MAQTLSDQERQFVIDLLETNSKIFLDDILEVSEEQWKFKPASDRWSMADVSEHITLSEELLLSIVEKTLQGAADEKKARNLEGKERQLLIDVKNRSTSKAQAPQVLRPTGKFATKKKLIETFIAVRQKTVDYVRTTNDPLKNHVANHPTWGDMTAYQWLIFIAVHADRHAAQLEEVKNDSNFPKI